MPERDLLFAHYSVASLTGFLLIRIVMTRIGRRRKSHRLEREIFRVLSQKGGGDKIAETTFGSDYDLRKVSEEKNPYCGR